MRPRVLMGDCLEVMATLPGASVNAVVTDPPYGLKFMGRQWDHGVPGEPYWREVSRVLEPGSYLVAFGGTRTYHRLTCAIEDAGFEIRDCLMWLYGSGFPKGKACLKPGWEPIVLARKPGRSSVLNVDGCRIEGVTPACSGTGFSTGKFAGRNGVGEPTMRGVHRPESTAGRWPANVVLSHDDECREVGTKRVKGITGGTGNHDGSVYGARSNQGQAVKDYAGPDGTETVAAWDCTPTCAVRLLDEQSGERKSGSGIKGQRSQASTYGAPTQDLTTFWTGDTGGASRFFYCSKASPSERALKCACYNQAVWESADQRASTPAAKATRRARGTTGSTTEESSGWSTSSSGNGQMDLFQTDTKSTTATTTSRTTVSPTSSLSTPSPTSDCTAGASSETASGGSPVVSAATSSLWTPNTGTYPPRDGRSTDDAALAISGRPSSSSKDDGRCPNCGQLTRSDHPTVKPLALMRWLVRLVTPAGGTVLDPFCGSGTTLLACQREGFKSIGIDSDPHAVEITRQRLADEVGPLFASEAL